MIEKNQNRDYLGQSYDMPSVRPILIPDIGLNTSDFFDISDTVADDSNEQDTGASDTVNEFGNAISYTNTATQLVDSPVQSLSYVNTAFNVLQIATNLGGGDFGEAASGSMALATSTYISPRISAGVRFSITVVAGGTTIATGILPSLVATSIVVATEIGLSVIYDSLGNAIHTGIVNLRPDDILQTENGGYLIRNEDSEWHYYDGDNSETNLDSQHPILIEDLGEIGKLDDIVTFRQNTDEARIDFFGQTATEFTFHQPNVLGHDIRIVVVEGGSTYVVEGEGDLSSGKLEEIDRISIELPNGNSRIIENILGNYYATDLLPDGTPLEGGVNRAYVASDSLTRALSSNSDPMVYTAKESIAGLEKALAANLLMKRFADLEQGSYDSAA